MQKSINIVVRNQMGGEVNFKVGMMTKFSKVFDTYYERVGVKKETLKFLFDGNRIQIEQTPGMLEMDEGDVIDAVMEQVGGWPFDVSKLGTAIKVLAPHAPQVLVPKCGMKHAMPFSGSRYRVLQSGTCLRTHFLQPVEAAFEIGVFL